MIKEELVLDKLLSKPKHFYEKFHTSTFIRNWKKKQSTLLFDFSSVSYKGYPRLPAIPLPAPQLAIDVAISDSLLKRRSERKINSKTIVSLKTLSTLLYFTAGDRSIKENKMTRRFYPSAGALYPIETYFFARKIDSLERALYHYYVRSHCLERIDHLRGQEVIRCFNQAWIKNAKGVVVFTAVFNRTTKKYGERGYRHVLIEAGHMAQNMYLVSAALGNKCCAIGGYLDSKVNKLLDIDGVTETIIYALALL